MSDKMFEYAQLTHNRHNFKVDIVMLTQKSTIWLQNGNTFSLSHIWAKFACLLLWQQALAEIIFF